MEDEASLGGRELVQEITRCMVIGAGAVGASLGQQLWRTHGSKVFVGAEAERARRYQDEGFLVNGELWKPEISSGEKAVDLVIIAVKHHQFHAVLPLIDRVLGSDTQVLSLLNGLTSEQILIDRYSLQHVVYGFTYGQDAVRDGNNIIYRTQGRVVIGEQKNNAASLTGRIERIKAFFEDAGIPVEIPEDMIRKMWWKLMVNVGMNQVSALYHAPYADFQRPGPVFDRMNALMQEVITVSKYFEGPLSQNDLDAWYTVLETMNPSGKTSMLQDVEAHRKTEVELFSGEIVAKAEICGIEVPENRRMLEELHNLESSYLN
jgi:2-dehydropantoate 2-reductase